MSHTPLTRTIESRRVSTPVKGASVDPDCASAGLNRARKPCACCGKNPRVSYTSYCLSCRRRKARRYYQKNRHHIYEQTKASTLRWHKKHPKRLLGYWLKSHSRATTLKQQKTLVGTIADKAGEIGRLVWPDSCDVCGSTSRKLHKHHEDYSRPLWLTTLCTKCHAAIHVSAFFWKRVAEEALPPNREFKSPDVIVAERDERRWLEGVLQSTMRKLAFRQREILVAHFGLWGQQPLTLEELGRVFRITRERVRQVEIRSLARLRVLLEAKGVNCA